MSVVVNGKKFVACEIGGLYQASDENKEVIKAWIGEQLSQGDNSLGRGFGFDTAFDIFDRHANALEADRKQSRLGDMNTERQIHCWRTISKFGAKIVKIASDQNSQNLF